MTDLPTLRTIALALPGVVETTYFRLPSFTIAGKGFATVESGGASAILAVNEEHAAELAAAEPDVFEPVHRGERFHVGVRIELAAVSPERLATLVEAAWRAKAPKNLQSTYTG